MRATNPLGYTGMGTGGDVPYFAPCHTHSRGHHHLISAILSCLTGATPVLMRFRDFQVLKLRCWPLGEVGGAGKSSGGSTGTLLRKPPRYFNHSLGVLNHRVRVVHRRFILSFLCVQMQE